MNNENELDFLYKLKKEVEKSSNTDLVKIINQVIKKIYLNQYTASFVGHFSAGKSTLINNLLEQEILPSSPVPTTSNTAIVTVSEEQNIIANLDNQKYAKLKSYDDVKKVNRLDVDVESVEINFSSNKFKHGFTFQDTPGVDSNVSSHQSMTEQFMYTSNVIFYTVDYNHVQSSLNFQFLKKMNDIGIPVVFVINQIDKHDEDEISFDTFKTRIQASIEDWAIQLANIFYVSKYNHPNNEMEQLSNYLVELDEHRESIEDYMSRTVDFITNSQLSYIQNQIQDILTTLDIKEEDFQESYLHFQENQAVSEEVKMLNNSESLMQFLKSKRKDILNNAYIMTHDLREKIRFYLESLSKDFKVSGLLNKKKKTLEEQTKRLEDVLQLLQTKVNQQIRQPLREDMSFLTRFISDSDVNEEIMNQHYQVKPELISDLYQPQTSISNTYVLTFSDEVVKALNKFIENSSDPLFEKVIHHAKANDLSDETDHDLNIYQSYIEYDQLRESLKTRNYQHYYIHMEDSLDKLIDRTEVNYQLDKVDDKSNERDFEQEDNSSNDTQREININAALKIINDIPLFEQTKKDIDETIQRLDKNVVKIGVFGTFSAGKSSLINALLGDHYLVSSPNPTTAATTEISYGDNNEITLKTEEQLLSELNAILETYDIRFDNIDEFINSDIQQLKQQLEKNHIAFINAVDSRYNMYKEMLELGLSHQIDNDEIKKWSAQDDYAAFVKTVHIKLPLDWLKDKIIIDSLGLHSNNERHTNETEQILTSSDLILYVSYFNHAFTDNDKAFMEHMKDMNQLKENQTFKMVINATDLAENKEDLDSVKQYVKQALNQVNLNPDIYAVSSRESLNNGDEGIKLLKESLDQFAKVDSKYILEQKMMNQLIQINSAYDELINEFKNDKEKINARQQKLKEYKNQTHLTDQLLSASSQQTINEIDEQIFHLNERLKLQLLDEVKSIYNSQMTQNSDFNAQKKQSTILYLKQIHQRLYLEQALISERIKAFYNQQLNKQIAPVIKKLEYVHVLVQLNFNFNSKSNEHQHLKLDLNEMLNALPKQLTKRKLLDARSQRDIQQAITNETVQLLQQGLSELRTDLKEYVNILNEEAREYFEQGENDIEEQINDLLSVEISDELIQQLEKAKPQLNEILS